MNSLFDNFGEKLYECFIEHDMWRLYLTGLRNTVIIAIGACLIGLIIGIIVACIRIAPKKNPIIKILDGICRFYITIIRGTPVVLQLFISYFGFLMFLRYVDFFGIKQTDAIFVAIITFGVNSGAYMAEIMRGSINAIDQGQMEAGRSLGLSWAKTFVKIILPQTLKSAIPTMFNEFITLIKETSVAGYVGILDLTKIQSYVTFQTTELFTPLLIIAAIYLTLVLILQQIQKFIERRLARSER
ncbi:MAG: amino acid ABC transporter permease [Clostridia bacterium]|nr:amino acid ABC transporter permease [Clostridia bacterium]